MYDESKLIVNAKPQMNDSGGDPLFQVMGKVINDGFYNSRMKIGQNDENLVWSKWQYERTFLDWFLWTALYTQSWVFRNGVDKKSDATVADIEIETDAEPTEINNVVALYDFYKTDLKYLLKQGMIYGGAAAAMLIKGVSLNTDKVLDVSKIKKGTKMSLYTRDRWQGLKWEGTAKYEALGTHDFGKHEFYKFYITGDTGKNIETDQKFHYSRVLRCGNRMPTQFTKFQLSGWDLPEGQHLVEELTRDETTRASIASLVAKSLIEVVKMPGIRGLFSGISGDLGANNAASRDELASRIKAVTDYRNFNNLSFLDKDDEYSQFQFGAMTGLADILQQQRKATSGAMEIPEMILYGSADNQGLIFQKDGTSTPEIEIYQQVINNRQEYILRPIMDKLLPILWRIANGTDMPEGTTYQFLPVFKEGETAKLERAGLVINNIEKLLTMKIFTIRDAGVEVRQHSKRTGFATNLTDEKINALPDEYLPDEEVSVAPTANAIEETPKKSKKEEKKSKKGQTGSERRKDKVNKTNGAKGYKFERRGGKK